MNKNNHKLGEREREKDRIRERQRGEKKERGARDGIWDKDRVDIIGITFYLMT